MASHRMPDRDRPRRPVPAWVTAPPHAAVTSVVADPGLEAHPAPVVASHLSERVASTAAAAELPPAAVASAEPDSGAQLPSPEDVVVPDFPPQQDLLPPAPTSPAVQVPTTDAVPVSPTAVAPSSTPAPTVAAALPAPPAPVQPAVPEVGQPRFSVPGLEHVVVEGTEPEPSGPIGYRTPARFARQQAPLPAAAPPQPDAATRAFDAIITPAAPASTPADAAAPAASAPAPSNVSTTDAGHRTQELPRPDQATTARGRGGRAPRLQAGAATTRTDRRPAVGATPGAALGALTGIATLALAAWWFTAPTTVHATGLALGVVALLLSATVLRDRTATWQRPLALLGAVLGGVGTLVLLWSVATALLPLAGVTLPDLTGTGATTTLAP
ncbi:hypothetical protein HUN58_15330 [Curtobacterium sp. Csp1]|uniref:hypothetical protein n=1 Tax=unclassified Curtobacterium TaxID=257496 RepID=UPI00159895FE|nr:MULTISPECIES: hypothetical protein [unclassified Curtobacterium]QKS11711.1 hypothetical protein HUN60_00010 [Curtobacterium sp. csp3]QKS14039.1 hypothetical protein HUN60_13595 [Curtobacterium sp. csp3]QKS21119.1 hypothetical protein HUN58_15330 [Curtobacterium sp. Csp1]